MVTYNIAEHSEMQRSAFGCQKSNGCRKRFRSYVLCIGHYVEGGRLIDLYPCHIPAFPLHPTSRLFLRDVTGAVQGKVVYIRYEIEESRLILL